jgi:hypothetical protein
VKKSAAVPATFCASVAALILSGCSSPVSVRRCVDPVTGTVLPDGACTSPVTAATYRGGRYARVRTETGSVCFDTSTNKPVADALCTTSSGYYPGYYHGGMFYRSYNWGYGGNYSNGRIRNFSTSAPEGHEIRSSSGSTISRGGLGSSGSSSSSGSSFS